MLCSVLQLCLYMDGLLNISNGLSCISQATNNILLTKGAEAAWLSKGRGHKGNVKETYLTRSQSCSSILQFHVSAKESWEWSLSGFSLGILSSPCQRRTCIQSNLSYANNPVPSTWYLLQWNLQVNVSVCQADISALWGRWERVQQMPVSGLGCESWSVLSACSLSAILSPYTDENTYGPRS